ncbi:MAG TPA: sigma-70 family RNA polymerase sigma factor [Phycisphaerae bacterium]|nr:sigma-70 family RNA polymerase sigma factor [Phycisphaerae bacterium]
MDDAERTLIGQCRAGDKAAFGQLVRAHAGRAIGLAYGLLGNRSDALDASQDAFVRAWRAMGRFDGRSAFYTWYAAILRNVCVSQLRKRLRRGPDEPIESLPLPSGEPDPSLLAERSERIDRIWRAVMSLPTAHREVIVMKHFQEMSYRQMAESLSVPVGTVTSRLHAARRALRELLAGERV